MKKIIYTIVIVASAIMASACSNSLREDNLRLTEEISRITDENKNLKDEILQLEQNNENLNKEVSDLQDKVTRFEEAGMDLVPGEGESLLNIYGANIDTYQPEVRKKLIIKDALPLEEKLDTIADNLSKTEFSGLGINVTKIQDKDGKKVAIVNLSEKTNEKGASWNTGYFQGSTGGAITSVSLRDTFLQKEYNGQWIDGVRFLYNNEEIKFDHVDGLSEISYR